MFSFHKIIWSSFFSSKALKFAAYKIEILVMWDFFVINFAFFNLKVCKYEFDRSDYITREQGNKGNTISAQRERERERERERVFNRIPLFCSTLQSNSYMNQE